MPRLLAWLWLCSLGEGAPSGGERWLQVRAPAGEVAASSFDVLVQLDHAPSGLQELEALFWAVAEPSSPKYGRFVDNSRLAELLGAPAEVAASVASWLENAGATKIQLLPHRDAFRAFLPSAAEAAKLLPGLQLDLYEHTGSGQRIARGRPEVCQRNLPQGVHSIAGVCGLPAASRIGARRGRRGRDDEAARLDAASTCPGSVRIDNPPSISWWGGSNAAESYEVVATNTETGARVFRQHVAGGSCEAVRGRRLCEVDPDPSALGAVDGIPSPPLQWAVTAMPPGRKPCTVTVPVGYVATPALLPADLRELYGVPPDLRATHPNASQAVYAEDGAFRRQDIAAFLEHAGLDPRDADKIAAHGPNAEDDADPESALDLQWISGMAPGSPTTYWNVPPHKGDGSFLEWAAEIAETHSPPLVHSVSYGLTEDFASTAGIPGDVYVRRVNTELMKIGLRGITLLFADGDAGATCTGRGKQPNCSFASPVWPATSPYGAAVGATFRARASSPAGGASVEEVAASGDLGTSWSTGGGFSYLSARPRHQDQAVLAFLNASQAEGSLPPDAFFLHPGWRNNRAIPDVAAVGDSVYSVFYDDDSGSESGTSASTPIFAGLVTFLNDARLGKGLPAMGPIGPFLYSAQSAGAFRDVTKGNNRCFEANAFGASTKIQDICCKHGFESRPGFDPVTGLGTPHFPALLQHALEVAAPGAVLWV